MLKINQNNASIVKNTYTFSVFLICAVCGLSTIASADSATFTGTSGAITTPNALIAETGKFSLQYNNFVEDRFVDDFTNGTNYIFTLGAYPRFELAGRLTDYDSTGDRYSSLGTLRGKRDLSANIKLNVFEKSSSLWVSLGANDFAGLAQNFTSFYGVVSGKWKNSLLSVGVSGGDNESFNGVFGSATYEVNSHLKLALEVDTESSLNGGFVATLPLGGSLELDATLAGVSGEARAGLTARFKLGKRPFSDSQQAYIATEKAPMIEVEDTRAKLAFKDEKKPKAILTDFASSLAEAGLQRVRVGKSSDQHYVVEFENRTFNYSDYDAISEIAFRAEEYLPVGSQLETVLLENGLTKYKDILSLDGSVSLRKTNSEILNESEQLNIAWVIPRKSKKRSVAEIFIEPALVSAVGTEFGTIDYSLAARLGVKIPLWKGARAIVGSYVPIHNSKNFESGNPYSRLAFERSLERAMLVQYLPLSNQIHTQFEFGQVQLRGFDYMALKLQGAWQSTRWPIRFHGRVGRYELKDTEVSRDVFLGSISYTIPRWETVFRATYGQFFFGESAVRIDATKRYGTTYVGLFAKVVANDDIAGGMKISLPIGPRKSLQWKRLSFSGSSRWSHALQTTVKFPNTSDNRLQTALLFEPLVNTEIPNYILDSGRLNKFDYEFYGSSLAR